MNNKSKAGPNPCCEQVRKEYEKKIADLRLEYIKSLTQKGVEWKKKNTK